MYHPPTTSVVNPNHCIEEWIDDSVDVILYERIFNWEIVAGNYLMLLLEVLIPECIDEYLACEDYWMNATDYDTYMATVLCARMALGARRIWPGKVRIYRRFGAFARDGGATHGKYVWRQFRKTTYYREINLAHVD
ncbi:hypothetical protein ANCDUO_10437 [Ancylostoma duodenale]|uniref:Uncharacterized protein n=1 Tax=Ancylostoma duodenale TaxID=51022 RepID=A0A0C2GKF1_9BILA|nr:hypothetical protein ANCDUO_10437 [Ancylostoma duodenale]